MGYHTCLVYGYLASNTSSENKAYEKEQTFSNEKQTYFLKCIKHTPVVFSLTPTVEECFFFFCYCLVPRIIDFLISFQNKSQDS